MSRWVPWYRIDVCGLDASLQPMGTGRGTELHLGTIIKAMKQAAGESVESIPGEQEWLRAQVGFLWEPAVEYVLSGMSIDDALELAFKRHMRALRSNIVRQVRLELDGIHMTPDGIEGVLPLTRERALALMPSMGRTLLSWKATWRGAGKAGWGNSDPDSALHDNFEENFWHWHVAEKAYCWAAQKAGLLPEGDATCRFEVLWLRGDYRGAGGPIAAAAEVTWTTDELKANWDVVVANRDRL